MLETQLVTYRVPADKMMPAGANVTPLNFAMNQPEMTAVIGTGWTPVNHSVTLLPTGEFLVSFMLTRDIVPAPSEVPYDLLNRD